MEATSGRRGLLVLAVALLLAAAAAVVLVAVDISDTLGWTAGFVSSLLPRYGVPAAFALLYIEESGVPLPTPGDVFVMYVGARAGINPLPLLAAWLGFVACVVLGSSNLYLLSRRFGRGLVERRLAPILHLTPERLARAERWFDRWGVLAIVFGRHVPGLRVPITVAAGTLRVSYPTFALSVAVSTAIWAGFFLLVGATVGDQLKAFFELNRSTYLPLALVTAVVVGVVVIQIARRGRAARRAQRTPGDQVSRTGP